MGMVTLMLERKIGLEIGMMQKEAI